jgi:hypothetical protein
MTNTLLLLAQMAIFYLCCTAFMMPQRFQHPLGIAKQTRSRLVLHASNNEDASSDMQSIGNKMIIAAAKEAGATEPMIQIDWKADRIVITVDVSADESYVADEVFDDACDDEEEWEDILYDADVDGGRILDEDDLNSLELEAYVEDDDDFLDEEDDTSSTQISVTKIARAINTYLSKDGEDSLGYKIAQQHEIEVTTPEFDGVLRGNRMFDVYKGFDVVVEHWEEDEKKKKKGQDASEADSGKKKVVMEGKLIGRDEEKGRTTVNVKGRMKNIKNELIECVRLPKAKREKGAK